MENPRRLRLKIQRDRYTPGRCYVVTASRVAFEVLVITQHHQADLKRWLCRVRKLYSKKMSKIVVGINARNSINCVGRYEGGRKGKVMHLELLQICVGEHCLLIEIDPHGDAHRSIKAFCRDFFQDDQFIFVGFGIEHIARQLYKDYNDTDFNNMAIIPNPVDLKELAACTGVGALIRLVRRRNCSLEMLVECVLGVKYEKPKTLRWYGGDYEYSDDLIMWSSVEVFLMAMVGRTLSN